MKTQKNNHMKIARQSDVIAFNDDNDNEHNERAGRSKIANSKAHADNGKIF